MPRLPVLFANDFALFHMEKIYRIGGRCIQSSVSVHECTEQPGAEAHTGQVRRLRSTHVAAPVLKQHIVVSTAKNSTSAIPAD